MLEQYKGGKFVRVYPTKQGTFDCKASNSYTFKDRPQLVVGHSSRIRSHPGGGGASIQNCSGTLPSMRASSA